MGNTLIYGYGNPGRQDDGLGSAFVDRIQESIGNNVQCDTNYQLNIEDAANIAEFDTVIFVDASKEDIEDFKFTEVTPSDQVSFTMHAVSPAYVLHLCESIYKKSPKTYLLHIKGYEWEMREELTSKGKENLEKALEFLQTKLLEL